MDESGEDAVLMERRKAPPVFSAIKVALDKVICLNQEEEEMEPTESKTPVCVSFGVFVEAFLSVRRAEAVTCSMKNPLVLALALNAVNGCQFSTAGTPKLNV